MNKFWSEILDGRKTTSSKRLITLIISAHFVLASFVILFLVLYVIMYLPKGKVEPELLAALKQVLEYDFYIILAGFGFITSEGVVSIIINKNKPSSINTPAFPADELIDP